MTRLSTAAPYYAPYRPPHADAFHTVLADRSFCLAGSQTCPDLGSGPGTIAVPLSRRVGHVYAVGPRGRHARRGRATGHRAGRSA
ncbi:hypothetical protein AB0F18_14460 [Streptomyces sp. NPDC029216]|uniref:hypothetical protein n=1 Tax=Streptomyces sp. NPDC029216 TaxID=3154701 RepID=UPI00340804E8